MPSPLTQEQLDEFKKRLERRRAEVVDELRAAMLASENEHYIQLAGTVHDLGEAAVADQLSDLANSLMERQLRELQSVDRALQRIADGRYGICTGCGGAIELERLRADPAVERCIACQERYEKDHPGRYRPTL